MRAHCGECAAWRTGKKMKVVICGKLFSRATSLVELFYVTGRTLLSESLETLGFWLFSHISKHLWTE